MTEQRRAILEALKQVTSHPTADEVYAMVRKRLPRISLGTVYRNLEFLSDSGLIQRLCIGGSQMRFDGNANNHYHVRCVKCNRVDDVPVAPTAEVQKAKRSLSGYEILGHRLEFVGVCPTCKS
jgi:Fur family ferric uptake transcriptional regulator